MIGISAPSKERIAKIVEEMFDNISLQFIGDIPRLKNKKLLVISSKANLGLSNLFVQAMQNKVPNAMESDMLRSLLESSFNYIESLKSKTMSNVTERLDGLAREAKIKKQQLNDQDVQDIIDDELNKAKSHMKTIVESESTKLRNLGTMVDILRVSTSIGDNDPTVFFVVIKDNSTCKECIRLHLMPDQITPRLWKFSELKQGYHKRGENNPSAFGLHPHCKCGLSYLAKGFDFDKAGRLTYNSEGFDAFAKQRKIN